MAVIVTEPEPAPQDMSINKVLENP